MHLVKNGQNGVTAGSSSQVQTTSAASKLHKSPIGCVFLQLPSKDSPDEAKNQEVDV